MKLFIILSCNKNLKGGNKMSQSEELVLIPKYEKYMQYMVEAIVKMPRTEKFNIGNEFKTVMYKTLENILYINKVEISKRMYYLSNCIKIQKKHSETTNLFMIHNMYLVVPISL